MPNTPPKLVRIVTSNANPHAWKFFDGVTGATLRNVRSVVIRAGVDQETMAELTLLHLDPPEFTDVSRKAVKASTVTVPAEVEMEIIAPTKEPAT